MAVQNKQQVQNPFGAPPLVQQMAQQQFAMKNGGVMQGNGGTTPPPIATVPPQNVFAGGRVAGKFEAPAVQPQQPATQPYTAQTAEETPQIQTNFEGMAPPPTGWNPDGSARYNSISSALSGYGQNVQPKQPEFQSDPSKRDGGFFSWLNGLIPKTRKGQRPGESDEDYDRRMTTNKERLLALGDAFRHLGNIAYTNKYAPVQQFNDPIAIEEAKYQQRKADRQKKAALDADAAYKQANLTLKERAAEAERQYKAMNLGFKQAAEDRARKKADDDNKKWGLNYERLLNNDAYNHKMAEDKFKEAQRHNKVSEGQGNKRLQIAQYNATHKGSGGSGGRSGSSGGKYWFIDKDGKYRYQPNKTMWEQEYYREYGSLPNETSTSTSTKSTDYKTGKETTQTTRTKGTPMAAQAAKQQNAAQQARKNASKPSTSGKGKSGGKKPSYANTKKLGL